MIKMKKYSLVGVDGNAYSILGYVSKAMKENNFSKEEIENYFKNAKSSDYNNLLSVSLEMLDKINEK